MDRPHDGKPPGNKYGGVDGLAGDRTIAVFTSPLNAMPRQFNNAGPSKPAQHYVIDPLTRVDLPDVLGLIDAERYFVLHAPRQTGKTTCLLALMDYLNAEGRYRAVYADIEGAQAARHDVAAGINAVTSVFADSVALYLNDPSVREKREALRQSVGPQDWFRALLAYWAASDPRPAVLLLDEVDALVGDTLISLLRQIRAGYAQRPGAFPQTVVLCGVRDVRDYRIHTGTQEIITGGSAFNIKAESLRLGNLSEDETVALWRQHEAETGQTFDPAIWPELWADTEGQPWLVNALGHQLTWTDKRLRDRTVPINLADYKKARERLIQSRATHLDALAERLDEARVRGVVAPILSGTATTEKLVNDDVQYVADLGLIVRKPELRIANRIYREVLPRELVAPIQDVLHYPQQWFVTDAHRLDMPKLLTAFQQFFREHSDAWLDGFNYHEAGPQLLMQAFLQRIINGGGRINREYGLGLRRTDLFIEWPTDPEQGWYGPIQRVVIELKLLRKGTVDALLPEALKQTADYADRVGADEAHIVVFDRREGVDWDRRIWLRAETSEGGREIAVWGA